jgi:hypothetical protein
MASIAPIQGQYLSIADQQSNVEHEIAMWNNRRQALTNQQTTISDTYFKKMQTLTSTTSDNNTKITTDQQAFLGEYEAAKDRLAAQDKSLDMKVKNLETKQKILATESENAQKQIQKNVEKECAASTG